MKSGIYKIVNTINNKFYIGSSKDLSIRWQTHVARLERNYHHNILLQRAWDKYGSDNFVFEVIETCDINKLLEREQYYLDTLSACNHSIGYNISPTAGRTDGMICSDETKQLLRSINLGKTASDETRSKQAKASQNRKHSNETISKLREINLGDKNPNYGKIGKTHHRARQIIQLDLDDNEVATWDSIMDAHRAGFDHSNILACTLGRIDTAYGYHWKYAGIKKYRCIYQFDLSGDLITKHDSVKDVIEYLNIKHETGIYNCLRGAAYSAYGYLWSYEIKPIEVASLNIDMTSVDRPRRIVKRQQQKKRKNVVQYSTCGVFIMEHPSLSTASASIGKSHHNISACCKHKTASAYNFIWVFSGDETMVKHKVLSLINPGSKARKIIQYTNTGEYIKEYNSLTEAKEAIGAATHANISSCCKGRIASAYGFVWKYND